MLSEKGFYDTLQKLIPNFREKKFLLAVSGGIDSMVLLDLFQKNVLNFEVAHINYNLRGEDSVKDKELVQKYCHNNHIKMHLYEVSENQEKPENSVQLWAREIRYRFFQEVMEKEKCQFTVTAHHLKDELETFIINLSRGSGIRGLSGIPQKENKILRPLLHFSREEIAAYANENNVDFREDKSNLKDDYLRNRIRHHIVPELLKTNSNFLQNFEKSITYLNEARNFAEENILKILNEISEEKAGKLILSKSKLDKHSDFVKFEILKNFGFDSETEIRKIFSAATGSVFHGKDYLLLINRDEIILKKPEIQSPKSEEITVLEKLGRKKTVDLSKFLQTKPENKSWIFDSQKLVFPLKIRHPKIGDVFFPIGMIGKKKVSKFFKDEKISIFDKPEIWLLADGNNEILGIIPLRQDKRYAADKQSESILKLLF